MGAGWHLGQHGLVLVDGTGVHRPNAKGAVRQPSFRDSAFQQPGGVHLGMVRLVSWSSSGPLAQAGWAARDRAELRREGQREARLRKQVGLRRLQEEVEE